MSSNGGHFGRTGGALLLFVAVVGGYLSLSSTPLAAADSEKDSKPAEEIATLLEERVALAKKACEEATRELGTLRRVPRTGESKTGRTSAELDRERRGLPPHPLKTRTPDEEVYRWSVRWLQAEHDLNPKEADYIAALEAHLKRMKELEEKVKNLVPDFLSDSAAVEAKWYRVEAALWLAQAKAKK
jgi:hypothetical protein